MQCMYLCGSLTTKKRLVSWHILLLLSLALCVWKIRYVESAHYTACVGDYEHTAGAHSIQVSLGFCLLIETSGRMNPLTQIKNTQKISKQEILQGVPESASWHARYKHSAYIYAGGLPFDLTEGDVLTVFAQYGELVDVHNVKDRDTGKYRGFSFLAYEDQRSTVLAVDNLNGATVGGRTVRVEHVDNYKKKKAEVGPRLIAKPLVDMSAMPVSVQTFWASGR